jgi:hypothetical protein
MPTQLETEAILGQLLRQNDASFDAAETGRLVSALDHPGADLARYRKRLDDLSLATAARTGMAPACFEAAAARSIVIWLLMNLRIRAAKAGDICRAIELVRRMTLN